MSIEGQPFAKRRYVTLDAMRGVAAIAVVMRHFGHAFQGWEPDSYLAVNQFFILSGFVLALNYDAPFASGMTAGVFVAIILALAFILDTQVDRPVRRRLLALTEGMGNAPLAAPSQQI